MIRIAGETASASGHLVTLEPGERSRTCTTDPGDRGMHIGPTATTASASPTSGSSPASERRHPLLSPPARPGVLDAPGGSPRSSPGTGWRGNWVRPGTALRVGHGRLRRWHSRQPPSRHRAGGRTRRHHRFVVLPSSRVPRPIRVGGPGGRREDGPCPDAPGVVGCDLPALDAPPEGRCPQEDCRCKPLGFLSLLPNSRA